MLPSRFQINDDAYLVFGMGIGAYSVDTNFKEVGMPLFEEFANLMILAARDIT